MPTYKNSKSQSKNGGRRRKQTKRKLRRGRKSRKVMRGGGGDLLYNAVSKIGKENETQLKTEYQTLYNNKPFNAYTAQMSELQGLSEELKNKLKQNGLDVMTFKDSY